MSDHLTEEEQLERLKRLWKEYGTTIIASVAVATAGYFGVDYWKSQQQAKAEQASVYYEQLVQAADASQASADTEQNEEDAATVSHLTQQIKDTAPDSAYAVQASLYAAKRAVEADDLSTAKTQLQWVLDNSSDPAMQQIARLRLARVLSAAGDHDGALAQLAEQPASGFTAEHAEVRGDILGAKGDLAAARTAYEKALQTLDSNQRQRRMVLQMKVDNLPSNTDSEEPSA